MSQESMMHLALVHVLCSAVPTLTPAGGTASAQLSFPRLRTRVWRACEICRKRKIKCDGQDPCAFCSTNKKDCTFKEITDYASGSRQITNNFETRLAQLEKIVMPMTTVFEKWAKENIPEMIILPSEPDALTEPISSPETAFESGEQEEHTLTDRFSHLTRDSLGNLRFIGGASSLVLVEALRSLRASQTPDTSPVSLQSETVSKSTENFPRELPFFRPNVHFRRFDVLAAHSGKPSGDHAFLSSLFAVFACAQSLSAEKAPAPASEQGWKWTVPSEYAGLELVWTYHYNLGPERSPKRLRFSEIAKEQRRRIWWCVYGLDRVLSISLGRPGATNEDDCDVEYPSQVDDDDLEAYCRGQIKESQTSYMCGFVALLKIYVVAGKIVRSAHSLQLLREMDGTKAQIPQVIHHLDVMLEDWIESLPPNVKYAANEAGNPKMLTLCLIAFFVYYSATINFHRPFIPYPKEVHPTSEASLTKCVSAARACIRIGDMVKGTLPTSHHLAYAVQQVCISGVILLRVVTQVTDSVLVNVILVDAEKCCSMLKGMQDVWSGAKRCKEIVAELLNVVKAKWDQIKHTFTVEKRKAEDKGSSRETRMRLDLLGTDVFTAEDHAMEETRISNSGAPHATDGLPGEFERDMSLLDPGALNPSFYGYDFLGNDLEVILGHVLGEDEAQSSIYDAQMLWEAWEGESSLS
ncbi:uncharacterized protein EV420DRAFT_1617658 [Desarmillaria tabescens]|uniref:Zn(2)-C6 fungal-type domain-containing protein n=1 Tax=Armillaria tabescens TaxID=1929756 RepID=A0AA39NIT0_ARMTA|nr:uncharacterized protein EV420DRAFT_1617658 [Desarmillaria tabescens]KAK0466401.1 hypothetical protein EV420DRAFT_1617658 [Desarmillaria tabescens]